ncbi:MAG: fumarylacetoacetate hydrolase family protein [Alphaproteobacteria bacterium]|nr:fumarylacetoacetate hydrolase family protein [Alphaproteobacteria bacterium]
MKLATFTESHRRRIGVVEGDTIVDLAAAAPDLPQSMIALLRAGPTAMAQAREVATSARQRLPLSKVRLEAPVPRPGKVLAIGMNYADHIRETGRAAPEHQVWFAKQATCIVGPNDAVRIPKVSDKVDYEAELCVVIGRRCRHVPAARAFEVIAGFMCGNDISVRDWQQRSPTMMMGKGFDTHGPTGPWIVTPDEIKDVHALNVRCLLNGEVMQSASTAEMIFKIPAQIEHLTAAFTLEPGDVIFTGTPAGVGNWRTPPVRMKAGDRVRVEIDGLGALENVCENETGETVVV